MALRQVGMVEVVGGVAGHAKLFHDPNGAEVCRGGEGNDLRQCEHVERVIEDGACALRGEPLAPVIRVETPSDLDRGCKVRLERGNDEADIPEELAGRTQFDGPGTEAVAHKVGFGAVDQGIALFTGEERGIVLHDARVGVDPREGSAIAGAPAAEKQAGGLHRSHGTRDSWLAIRGSWFGGDAIAWKVRDSRVRPAHPAFFVRRETGVGELQS